MSLYMVEWTEEPEMEFFVEMTESEAAGLKAQFEKRKIPYKIENPHINSPKDILELLENDDVC